MVQDEHFHHRSITWFVFICLTSFVPIFLFAEWYVRLAMPLGLGIFIPFQYLLLNPHSLNVWCFGKVVISFSTKICAYGETSY
eukprot:UN25404